MGRTNAAAAGLCAMMALGLFGIGAAPSGGRDDPGVFRGNGWVVVDVAGERVVIDRSGARVGPGRIATALAASIGPPRAAPSPPAQDRPPTAADFARDRYEAMVLDVHDGDTFKVVPMRPISIRIEGIDAPEMRDNAHGKADPVAGPAARDGLKAILSSGRVYVVETAESFGRKVARVYVQRGGKLVDVGEEMVAKGFARPYLGVLPQD